jgi:tRNA(fMet)-specific endonuclease VapC
MLIGRNKVGLIDMVVLDTDILVGFLRNNLGAVNYINKLRENNEELNLTIFNVAELKKGCYLMKNVAKGLLNLKKLIESLDRILFFDLKSSEEYAKISSDLRKRGSKIGNMDELISSICISNDETLISRNSKHFQKVLTLKLEEW